MTKEPLTKACGCGYTWAEGVKMCPMHTAAPDLLAALKRSEQYIHVAIMDGRNPPKQKLNEETIAIAERDLTMVQDAIKAAT